jgi:hypothetical protein
MKTCVSDFPITLQFHSWLNSKKEINSNALKRILSFSKSNSTRNGIAFHHDLTVIHSKSESNELDNAIKLWLLFLSGDRWL